MIEVTEDAFLGGRLTIAQPAKGYRAGIDAVVLAASVPWPREQATFTVLDVGAGVGTVGLCVARRCLNAQVTLLERERELAAIARANIERNGLALGRVPEGGGIRLSEHLGELGSLAQYAVQVNV